MLKRRIRMELDSLLNDMRMNLENNYKDLAHDALKKFHTTLDAYEADGLMKEKDYIKYKKVADDYSKRMENYHH